MQYWINNNGVQAGPVTLEELKNMHISPDTYVWHSGMDDWEKIGDLPELRGLLSGEIQEISPEPTITPEPAIAQEPAFIAPEPEEEQDKPDIEVDFLDEDDDISVAGDFADDDAGAPEPAVVLNQLLEAEPAQAYAPQAAPPYTEPRYAAEPPAAPADDESCPPTNLVWSIIVTVLCCSIVGIAALVMALMVKPAYQRGDMAKARRMSEWSAWLCIASIILGLISGPIYMAFSAFSLLP